LKTLMVISSQPSLLFDLLGAPGQVWCDLLTERSQP
jgi:hypothetical protein